MKCYYFHLEEKIEKNNKEIEEKINKEIEEKMERHEKKNKPCIIWNERKWGTKWEKSFGKEKLAKMFQDLEIEEEPLEHFRLGKTKVPGKERPLLYLIVLPDGDHSPSNTQDASNKDFIEVCTWKRKTWVVG